MAYADSDWYEDILDRKITMGYIFMVAGAPISWCSTKQKVVALSTCEAEYIGACLVACQPSWLSSVLMDLGMKERNEVERMLDSKSAIDLTRNHVSHGRSKHIETRYHYIRQQVAEGRIKLTHCRTNEQLADIMTKASKKERF
ncbi:unnamed protein product [Lupinus luteus]|uniref:Uncharacterized protein n=1 Tax=Lupinus luteus TaxID=3873 RepID=A0AAV1WNM7_LUPLU